MKIKSKYKEETDSEYARYTIEIDGKVEFDVIEGEPEDRSLFRDFNDCLKVCNLLEMAYEAGKKGEPLEIIKEDEN